MAEVEVLAELLAVVRGDDHVRVLQEPTPLQLVEQATELVVEEGDAIMVTVAGQPDVPPDDPVLVHRREIAKDPVIA